MRNIFVDAFQRLEGVFRITQSFPADMNLKSIRSVFETHKSGEWHAQLGLNVVRHNGCLVDVVVSIKLETAGVNVVQLDVAEVFDLLDAVIEGLHDTTGTTQAKE